MAQQIAGVNPTRMELLKLRKRIKLAKKGHKLLKEKRDALIMEFFNALERARKARKELNEKLAVAHRKLVIAEAVSGTRAVKTAAMAVSPAAGLKIDTRNVVGVIMPAIEKRDYRRKLTERGYGFVGTSANVDEAAAGFEEAMNHVLEVAEIEGALLKLAAEIEKTKRRVNALEYNLIPKLVATQKYIRMRLSEMERENFFRLKIIKRRLTQEA